MKLTEALGNFVPLNQQQREARLVIIAAIERLKEETQLLALVTRERDELRAVVAEIDEGDNPELWGELVKQRDESLAEIKRLKQAMREAGG